MNKLMAFYDGLNAKEDSINLTAFNTSIDIKNLETGEVIFKGLKNKVILPGSGLIARKLFDIDTDEITPSYNEAITGMEAPTTEADPDDTIGTTATADDHKILLFCCGLDGCGSQNSQVYPVDYTKWISPSNLVPFRYNLSTNDISDELRATYYGRTPGLGSDGAYVGYYFKRFEGAPRLVQQYTDGTLLDSTIYDSVKEGSAETYVELNLKITKEDIRDYFVATVGIDQARINSISLCSAYPVLDTASGFHYFKDIRPVTKLNIPNEQLIDVTKGIEIIYHIYM